MTTKDLTPSFVAGCNEVGHVAEGIMSIQVSSLSKTHFIHLSPEEVRARQGPARRAFTLQDDVTSVHWARNKSGPRRMSTACVRSNHNLRSGSLMHLYWSEYMTACTHDSRMKLTIDATWITVNTFPKGAPTNVLMSALVVEDTSQAVVEGWEVEIQT